MRKSKKFISLPVISTNEGIEIGSVRKLVIDPTSKKVVALVLNSKKRTDNSILLYSNIRSIGTEAITVDSEEKVKAGRSLPEIAALLKTEFDLVGSKLVVENGVLLGHINDFWVEKESGRILYIDFSDGLLKTLFKGLKRLDIKNVKTIGREIVIAREGTEQEVIETGKFKKEKKG